LTLNDRMGQGACRYCFCLQRQRIFHLWMFATSRQLDYTIHKTKNPSCSVDAHFQDGAGNVLLVFLPLKAANTSLMDVCNQLPFRLPGCNTNHRWCSLDAGFQDEAECMSLCFVSLKAANTSFMDGCNQSPLRLPKMQSQQSLTLCWYRFADWGSDRVICYFTK